MKNKTSNLNLSNKKEYKTKFDNELSKRRLLNKYKRDIYNMSIKRPIPFDNYDYYIFNYIPKIHKEMYIKDLTKFNKRYIYKYLIGKIISKLYWDDYIYFLVEDKNRDIISISIYHFENKWYPLSIESLEKNLLSIGKYILFINPLLVKEHYEQILCLTTNEFIIFDNHEEIINFLKLCNGEMTEENLKKIGDLMMIKNKYEKSIYYYDKAIKKCTKFKNNDYKLLILLYDISLAYFNYGYYTKSLYYCNNSLDIIKNNINNSSDEINDLKLKLFYIKIKGLISLRKYEEGFELYEENKNDIAFSKFLNKGNNNSLIKEIILKKENQNGIYNFKEMLLEEEKNFYLTYGDYINSKIDIAFDKEKGIKIICKKNNFIKKGELVIVEKALVSKKEEDNIEKRKILGLNSYDDDNFKKEEPYQNLEMTNELMEKVKKYKEDYEIFFILYNGDNKNLNIEERKGKYLNGEEKRIGFKIFKKVIDSNKYSALRNIGFLNKKGFGLWGYTSILNHSCNPNVNYFSIGDFMICFATKKILEGEELTTLYINNSSYYTLRQERCFNNWGFHCSCDICIYDKNNINDKDKKYYEDTFELLYKFRNNIQFHKEENEKFVIFEKFLIEKKNKLISFELINGYLQLIYHYGILDNYNKCREISEIISNIANKDSYYSFELENLNMILSFFGYKDKNIFNDLIKKYEIFGRKNIPLKEEEFKEIIKNILK